MQSGVMDASRGLITKVVDDAALNTVLRSGITTEFLDEDSAAIFNYIQRHYADYKVVPSRGAVKTAFPAFEFINTRETLEYFIDVIKESFRRNILETKLDELSQVYNTDIAAAETLLRDALSELVITQKTHRDVDVAQTATDRFEAYRLRAENPGATGILSGWSKLDYETLGFQAEQFIVLVGEKWMGKSWMMLWLAYKAAKSGERVLFVTKEMSQAEITERFDALWAGIPYKYLRRGELDAIQEDKYQKALDHLSNSNVSFTVARQGVHTIEDIEFKAVEMDATIVFGDSIYLFPPNRKDRFAGETNKRMAISQECKKIAQSLSLPFVVSVQAGRKQTKNAKPDIDDIEWSNSFSQDADVVLYLHKDELDKELRRAQMHLLKVRGGEGVMDFFIEQDFENMDFSQRNDSAEPSTNVFHEDDEGIFSETLQ